MEKDRPCEFKELCEECHPEQAMVEKRKTCSEKNSKKCGIFWAYRDGYNELHED